MQATLHVDGGLRRYAWDYFLASNDNFMCYYAGLEYSRCDVFRRASKWGIFGADGLFSVVKEVLNILYPELQGQLGDKDDDKFHSNPKKNCYI